MTRVDLVAVDLVVNGRKVVAEVEPRTHLADFLRETLLLTGTHLGCEQGVCGACTVLLNDEPVRSCLMYAGLCGGAAVCSIEGLDNDPVTVALRAAFSAEHALQCGYCTPGMLATARDIVRRLPGADDDRIRLELAGNLCRCTGYNGIVKAIRLVLDAGAAEPLAAPVPLLHVTAGNGGPAPTVARAMARQGTGLHQSLRVCRPVDVVWDAIQDPAVVASCVPGARLTAVDGSRVEGEMQASLGPIQTRFAGEATLVFDPPTRTGRLSGEGRDSNGGTRLSGEATFAVLPDGPEATLITLEITYALRGPLAQFSRGPVVEAFAAEITAAVARNLEARLQGREPMAESLGAGRLFIRALWRVLWRWVAGKNG
jgi:aerobic carbon-monoxide dehydrogenase small subunit